MSLRSKVLQCFKSLHRARLEVFAGDTRALTAARLRINEEFLRNKHEDDPGKIQELIKVAEDSEELLRKTVVQGIVKGDVVELRVTKNTLLTDEKYPNVQIRSPRPPKRKR